MGKTKCATWWKRWTASQRSGHTCAETHWIARPRDGQKTGRFLVQIMGIYYIVLFDSFRLFQRPMNSSPMLKSRVIYCPFILVCHWIESEPAPVLFFLGQVHFRSWQIHPKLLHGSRVRSKSQCIGCIRERLTVDVVDVCDGWPFIKEDTMLTIFTSSCPKVLSESGPCMVVSSSPPLLLAGDYFTSSSFSGCFQRHICSWNMDGITVDLCWSIVY